MHLWCRDSFSFTEIIGRSIGDLGGRCRRWTLSSASFIWKIAALGWQSISEKRRPSKLDIWTFTSLRVQHLRLYFRCYWLPEAVVHLLITPVAVMFCRLMPILSNGHSITFPEAKPLNMQMVAFTGMRHWLIGLFHLGWCHSSAFVGPTLRRGDLSVLGQLGHWRQCERQERQVWLWSSVILLIPLSRKVFRFKLYTVPLIS